jgi:hypothetical protein
MMFKPKSDSSEFIDVFYIVVCIGAAIIATAYAGSLWTESRTKTKELAACQEMLPNLAIDCPLAAQVAECDVKYPWATCETTRGAQ